MNYQQKLIILPTRIEGEDVTLNITVFEAEGTGLAYNAMGGDEKNGWVITHLESKKELCSPIGTEHEVKMLLERVASITDWNMPEKELKKKHEVGAELQKCQQTVAQGLNMELESAMKQSDMPDYLIEDAMNEMHDNEYTVLRSALLHAFKIAH